MNDELKERVKALAVEAGVESNEAGDYPLNSDAFVCDPDDLERFAQAVARDCAEIAREAYRQDAFSEDHDDGIAAETATTIAKAILSRYGLGD